MTMRLDAFELLHPRVQEAVLTLGWQALNPLQEKAIPLIIQEMRDAIICAPTSGGKTEAVFLPVLSHLVRSPAHSFQVLYVSPLKALINDQFDRLTSLCRSLNIPVHKWHGDVDDAKKRKFRKQPRGILLITPESLESNFLNFGNLVPSLYRHLNYVIIDELHAILDNERGIHLRSLLSRLFDAIGSRPRCFALSATLADPHASKVFINPEAAESVVIIQDLSNRRQIKVKVKTFSASSGAAEEGYGESGGRCTLDTLGKIAQDILQNFQDSSNLIFANNRKTVELLADYLRHREQTLAESSAEFALHHGSLSAQVRHKTEMALKSGLPTNALCTSSLELGIDIGAIAAVAQIDPTWSVTALVQRLGRSGRRGDQPSVLRLYVRSEWPDEKSGLDGLLFPRLLHGVASINLLLAGWLEPSTPPRMHLSTLTHQVLSKLKEFGALPAIDIYKSLCQRGPFRRVTSTDFATLLRGLCREALIEQTPEGDIVLGLTGERITSAPDFYAAFATHLEFSVRHMARHIGKLPVSFGIKPGECMILNGRRWLIEAINWRCRTIWVTPSKGRKAPVFRGEGGELHSEIFAEMRRLLRGNQRPTWLDPEGQEQLGVAREAAERIGLLERDVVDGEGEIHWFPWVGTRASMTLALWAKHQNLECSKDFLSLKYPGLSMSKFESHLKKLIERDVDPFELAALFPTKQFERFDSYINEALLIKANAIDRLDLIAAKQAAHLALSQLQDTKSSGSSPQHDAFPYGPRRRPNGGSWNCANGLQMNGNTRHDFSSS